MAKDPREYGFEGEMAMSQLKGIMQHAKQLHDMLKPDTDLPEWVQKKLTLAYDYMQTAADYMSTEMSEEVQIDELSKDTMKSYHKKAFTQYVNMTHGPTHWNDQPEKIRDKAAQRMRGMNMADRKLKKEEAPTNAAGGGNIAGMGVGPDGEPGITPKAMARYKRKNKEDEPKAGRKAFSIFMKGK
jgi:hypothetical protein